MASTFVMHFSNDFPGFLDAELKGIVDATGIDLSSSEIYSPDCPFRKYHNLTLDDVTTLCSRSISLRAVYEYWCESESLEDLLHQVSVHVQQEKESCTSYKICIEPFNRSYTNRTKERLLRIDALAEALNIDAPVKLSQPDAVYSMFEYFGPHGTQSTAEPLKFYFGKLVSESGRERSIRKFNIKTRKFIGNTSMDPTLSLLMANMAGVTRSSLVLDPFVGTGSLLLACAHYGAYTVGTDINKVLLHGRGRSSRAKKTWRGRDENVRANFIQYNMEDKYLDVLVADASKHNLWAMEGLFDAVVTDPPYGIREQTLKLEAPAPDSRKPYFMPPTSQYNLSDVFTDLLALCSRCLTLGGKLVFWLPIFRPDYHEENIPSHPCFKLVSNCEQILSTFIARRLITLQKVREPSSLKEDDWVGITNKDHYSESFRDRYFQISDQLNRVDLCEDSTGSTKPATGSTKPATGSTKPATGSTKPATGSTKPATGSTKPAAGSTKPATGSTKPATGSTKPATGSTKPATGSTKPATGSTKPATGVGSNLGNSVSSYSETTLNSSVT
ncbi:TRMT11 [Bugula neritina]|uniref:tRNA (guanine(10)-N(2))-methyltransferase TRMT11 n=1 Tax=Bugula neritina TaxID=10212 RepID=A0A7J7JR35_BUGNE|nr:TRMT11 [Bugula neritina]